MSVKHGDCETRFYGVWSGMKSRCNNKNRKYYANGITVCSQWQDYRNFKTDMYESYVEHCEMYGEYNTTIDRIESLGNYTPTNCRWATYELQAKNRKSNIFIYYNGKTQCLNDWAKELGIQRLTLTKRIKSGWSIEEAFETPVTNTRKRSNQTMITFEGMTRTINEWSEITGLPPSTIRTRYNRGWEVERILTKN